MTAIPFQPGDKVRVTIDATVAEVFPVSSRTRRTYMCVRTDKSDSIILPFGDPAVTILPGTAEPMGFEDCALAFERVGEVIDGWQDGTLTPHDALTAIHEMVGDRPERLGGAS